MSEKLSSEELLRLVGRVFRPGAGDRSLAVLCDLPDDRLPDDPGWSERRRMAAEWVDRLRDGLPASGIDHADLVHYRNARRNNADLPDHAFVHEGGDLPTDADSETGRRISMEDVFASYRIMLAPTQLSATAPLKLHAPRFGFRAATMGGFSAAMIPALRLDWVEIDARCRDLKALLDEAESAEITLCAAGVDHHLDLDLRHRAATASGGLLTEPGRAGNLPSGETYIVPYEGEVKGDPSRTRGSLPMQLEGELLVLEIEGNRVRNVLGDGPVAARERHEFEIEPAYRNVAELGLGLLRGYGIQPVGSLLLDEKLGLHIAFGRSDHFGGQTRASDFSAPDRVVHIDRVYIPEVQPKVEVRAVDLTFPGGAARELIRDGDYV